MNPDSFEVRQLPLSLDSCREQVDAFLEPHGLRREEMEYYAGVFSVDRMLAGGGYQGNVIKCIAAQEEARGLGLINLLVTHLRALLRDRGNLFVFTKPDNREIFESLSFTLVGEADKAVLLESDSRGVQRFCQSVRVEKPGPHGAVVMNCNPFTLGHQYLVDYAAAHCAHLYLFVVEEDRSAFPFPVRLELAHRGTAHLDNVTVCSGGPYIISNATFPTYFLKTMNDAVVTHTALDMDIFARQLAPRLDISVRFAGEEPKDPVTATYNKAMARLLPPAGIALDIIPRREKGGRVVSAGRVRMLIKEGRLQETRELVPPATYEYIMLHGGEINL